MKQINILFLQSQYWFPPDSQIHRLILANLHTEWINVHVACNPETNPDGMSAWAEWEKLPHIRLLPIFFGTPIFPFGAGKRIAMFGRTMLPLSETFRQLAAYIRQHKIDVIHCTEKPREAVLAVLLAKVTGAKSMIHLHTKVDYWFSRLSLWAMRHADALVGVSKFTAQAAVDFGFDPARVHVVPNGVDVNLWSPKLSGKPIREEFRIDRNTVVISIIGRLINWKGHGELLRALALLKDRLPDFRLLIVGKDHAEANWNGEKYSAELFQLVHQLGLEHHIIFTGFRADVPSIMAATDIFCMPSPEEGFGLVYVEAMLMQVPVVALKSGGAAEIVDHGHTGLLADSNAPDALAKALETLMTSEPARLMMGMNARARAMRHFNATRMAANMEHCYRQVAGGYLAQAPALDPNSLVGNQP